MVGDILPTAEAGGFSVRPRRLSHESPKGLPGPLDVQRSVFVTVQYEATGGTDMGAHAQSLRHTLATPAAILAGVVGGNRDDSPPSICCFGVEDSPKLRPTRIVDALVEACFAPRTIVEQVTALAWSWLGALRQILDVQVFIVDHVIVTNEG